MKKLFVQCKSCGREFETTLQVPEEEFSREGTFNSMEICPHCRKAGFYVKDSFFFKDLPAVNP